MTPGSRRTAHLTALASATLALLASVAPHRLAADTRAPASRVISVGDIHGEIAGFEGILREVGAIDAEGRWVAENTILVQTGDMVDRGAGTRQVMDLLRRLESEAPERGSRVQILLGNHEIMNLTGDYREVTPEILATFTDEDSEKRRKQALQEWRKWLGGVARAMDRPPPSIDKKARESWLDEHPPGFVEFQEAMGPRGEYGRWLLEHPFAVEVENVLYQHAGISPAWADRSLQEIDRDVKSRIETWEETRLALVEGGIVSGSFHLLEIDSTLRYFTENPFPESRDSEKLTALVERGTADLEALFVLFSEDSPIWFRGYTKLPDEELSAHLDRLEEAYGASRFVAGHTPNGNQSIVERLGGRLYLIDAGMLTAVYGGRAAALEISGDRVTAVYPGEREVLAEPAAEVGSRWRPPEPPRAILAVRRAPASARAFPAAGTAESGAATPPARVFRDSAGEPLPIQDPAELASFMATARVLSREPVGVGKTGAERLLLERDGLRVRAIFHNVDEQRGNPRKPVRMGDGTTYLYYRDSYESQVAAFELARVMGLDNVPPAVVRQVDGETGSVALWIENGQTLTEWREERGLPLGTTPRDIYFERQRLEMNVWDNLVANTDRNEGNIFWTPDGNLWLIDHTRTLARDEQLLRPDAIQMCSRDFWNRLEALDESTLHERLAPYLSRFEIKALVKRQKAIVKILEKRIRQLGEGRVLFDYDDPGPGLKIVSEPTGQG